jgi:hypothetical protein
VKWTDSHPYKVCSKHIGKVRELLRKKSIRAEIIEVDSSKCCLTGEHKND